MASPANSDVGDKLVLLMLIVLAIYVSNLPGDPFTGAFDIPAPFPAIAALVAAFLIPKIAVFWGSAGAKLV